MANSNIKVSVRTNKQNVPLSPIDKDPFYVGAKAEVEQTEWGALVTMEDKDGRTQAEIHHGEKGEKGDKGDASDYEPLENKPLINDVVVQGSKIGEDYHLQDKMHALTTQEIERILYL